MGLSLLDQTRVFGLTSHLFETLPATRVDRRILGDDGGIYEIVKDVDLAESIAAVSTLFIFSAKGTYCGLCVLSNVSSTGSLVLAARFSAVACISPDLSTKKLWMPVRPKTTGRAVIVKL